MILKYGVKKDVIYGYYYDTKLVLDGQWQKYNSFFTPYKGSFKDMPNDISANFTQLREWGYNYFLSLCVEGHLNITNNEILDYDKLGAILFKKKLYTGSKAYGKVVDHLLKNKFKETDDWDSPNNGRGNGFSTYTSFFNKKKDKGITIRMSDHNCGGGHHDVDLRIQNEYTLAEIKEIIKMI